jgi:MarR family transcriptional regulator, transcriptional regulator for hemolysin
MLKPPKTRPTAAGHRVALERADEALALLARFLRVDTERATTQAGLSFPMAVALGRLASLPEQTTVTDLARSLECNMGNLSVTLDRLEEGGYVERLVCEADRRARYIRLTAKGRRMKAQLTEIFRNGRVCTALKRMDTPELEALSEVIDRLNNAVKTDAVR